MDDLHRKRLSRYCQAHTGLRFVEFEAKINEIIEEACSDGYDYIQFYADKESPLDFILRELLPYAIWSLFDQRDFISKISIRLEIVNGVLEYRELEHTNPKLNFRLTTD